MKQQACTSMLLEMQPPLVHMPTNAQNNKNRAQNNKNYRFGPFKNTIITSPSSGYFSFQAKQRHHILKSTSSIKTSKTNTIIKGKLMQSIQANLIA